MLKYLGICFAFFSFVSVASVVPFTQVPEWVERKTTNQAPKVPTADIRNGVYYLLVDQQTRVTNDNLKQAFRHYSTLTVNPEGVEQGSQVNINFDPNYQQLQLHQLTVWRDGVAIDKRYSAKMSLLQREAELDKLIYNGDQTLNILIDDVRINDIIEYSYSIAGSNPVFADGFSLRHSLNWSIPIESLFILLVWQQDHPLYTKVENNTLVIQEKKEATGRSYWLEDHHVVGINTQEDTPNWFSPHGVVTFTNVANWAEVIQWGTDLFDGAIVRSDQIRAIAQEIVNKTADKSGQIAEILKFVQTQIRYLGIEFGENSHRPSIADETLTRHYGDCKDKVVLFITLLKEIGVVAVPALVNTNLKQTLINELPRYGLFDHVIARVEFEGKSYWLDPTITYQAGGLNDIYQPDYGYALILNGQGEGLTPVEIVQAPSTIKVNEIFHLYSTPNMSAQYEIKTAYSRLEAQRTRSRIGGRGLSQIRADYLAFYLDYYDSLKVEKAVEYSDDLTNNTLIGLEQYHIEQFWIEEPKRQKYSGDFYANLISPSLRLPDTKTRTQPLAVEYPVDLQQIIMVYFDDENWLFDDKVFEEDNPFFTYRSEVTFDPKMRLLRLDYRFVSKVDQVSADQFKQYITALKNAKKHTSYGIQKNFPTAAVLTHHLDKQDWILLAAAGYGLLLILAIGLWHDNTLRHRFNGPMVYYPVSLAKMTIFWLATLGLYSFYWFYKNWQYCKEQNQQLILPWARSLFSSLWYYPLYLAVTNQSREAKVSQGGFLTNGRAATLAILFFTIGVSSFWLGQWLIVTGLLLVTLPLAYHINALNGHHGPAIRYNSDWKFGGFLVFVIALPLLPLGLGYELGLLPSDKVIDGRLLQSFDLKYLQRKKVIRPQDTLKWFYSDGFLSIREDGNGISDRHVFSYWQEEGKLEYETAEFTEIKSIDVTWSKTWYDQTVIEVIRKDQSQFLLFVANVDQQDRVFVAELEGRLQQLKE